MANAGIGMILAKYTSSEQAAFLTDHVDALELTTAITQHRVQTGLPTSTAFAAGDRLVIKMTVAAVGTMGASQTVTMDYDGPTAEADGDSYIDVGVIATPTRVQFGAGGAPIVPTAATVILITSLSPAAKAVEVGRPV